jgi:hypothetical protein
VLRGHHPELQELNLDVPTEELLSAERAFTYEDLYAMFGNEDTIVWLTPRTAVARTEGIALHACNQLDQSYCFFFSADGKDVVTLLAHPSI